MELVGGKANNLGVLVDILRDSQRFREVDRISGDTVDTMEYRCRLTQ